MSKSILSIRDLDITFHTSAGDIHAIRGINLELPEGKTVALVGESGSGKSVTMKAVTGLLDSNAGLLDSNATVNRGEIIFDSDEGEMDILSMSKRELRQKINGRQISMVFQDPMTSLDPTMQIGKQIVEGILLHTSLSGEEAWEKAEELMNLVGIPDAKKRMKNFPHQLSGGMRQRIVIAIALACEPRILICDPYRPVFWS